MSDPSFVAKHFAGECTHSGTHDTSLYFLTEYTLDIVHVRTLDIVKKTSSFTLALTLTSSLFSASYIVTHNPVPLFPPATLEVPPPTRTFSPRPS